MDFEECFPMMWPGRPKDNRMLTQKFIKSLFIALIFMLNHLAHAQVNNNYGAYTGHINEPLPSLLNPPQDNSIYNSANNNKINRIQINSVQWSQSGELDHYAIYPDLSFDFIKKYDFRIIPSFKTHGKVTSLPDGYYYLKAVLLRPKLKQGIESFDELTSQYVTGTERVVHADNGIIATSIAFSFPSLSSTTSKNRLLMEIIPLKQNAIKTKAYLGSNVVDLKKSQFIPDETVETVVLSIPFIPQQKGDSVSTVDKVLSSDITYNQSFDITAIMTDGVRKLNEKINSHKIPGPKQWAEHNKVAIQYDDKLYNTYASLTDKKEICEWIDKNTDYKISKYQNSTVEIRARNTLKHFCLNEKNSFIFQKAQFVAPNAKMKLLDEDTQRRVSVTQLSITLSKGNNQSKSLDEFQSLGITISPLSPLEFFGIKLSGLALNKSYSFNQNLSTSVFESGITAENMSIEVRRLSLKIEASEARSCILMQLNQKHTALMEKTTRSYLEDSFGKDVLWGAHMVCKTKREPTVFHEAYFHILPNQSDGIADTSDPRNQIINMTLRGYPDYQLFKFQIRKSLNEQYLKNVMPTNVLTSVIPSETTPGVHFINNEINPNQPSFLERTLINRVF